MGDFGRRFGASFLQNLGGMGMDYFGKKAEDKRAYTRLKNESYLKLLAEYGPGALTPSMMQELESTMPGASSMFGPEWKGTKAMESQLGVKQAGEEAYAREAGSRAAGELFPTPEKPPKKSSDLQMFEAFTNMPIEEFGKLPNDQKRNLLREWSALKRKEETAKTIRPRYQIIKNESTGKVTKIDLDTNEEIVLRPEDPALMKKAKAKEEAERIKQEKDDAAKASSIYDRWLKAGRPPEGLRNLNVALEPFGYEVVEKLGEKNFLGLRGDTDYLYQKVGQVNKDPSQMTDEELAAEVARINRGQ